MILCQYILQYDTNKKMKLEKQNVVSSLQNGLGTDFS